MQSEHRMKMSRPLLLLALTACGAIGVVAAPAFGADAALQHAVDGSWRSAANKARDRYRHPIETLEFFGLRPDMTVIELEPGGGWYTEILAPVLHDRGHLIEATPPPTEGKPFMRHMAQGFADKLKANPAVYGKVTTVPFAPPSEAGETTSGASSSPESSERDEQMPIGALADLSLAPARDMPAAIGSPESEEPVGTAPLEEAVDEHLSVEEPEDEDLPTAVDASGEIPAARTLAALYEKQGFSEDARRIYDRLGEEPSAAPEPGAAAESSRAPVLPADPVARKRQVLESWLARVKSRAAESR